MIVINNDRILNDDKDNLSYSEKLFIVREIGDFEHRFYFNPGKYNVEEIRPLMTLISLRVGGVSADLGRIRFGEVAVKLNPLLSGEEDRRFIKQLFLRYFDGLSQVTL